MLLFSEIRSNLKKSTTQADIQMLGNSMYIENMLTMLACTIIAVIIVILVVRNVTKPVFRLMESVRGGVEGIHSFEESGIREIDELHDVIKNLTDTQKLTQNRLMEEKERYRIAVESSQDLFFTYKRKEQSLEIVNSNGHDGMWNCDNKLNYIDGSLVHPKDRARVLEAFAGNEKKLNLECRIIPPELDDYIWVQVNASVYEDENGESDRFVGCIHNIQQQCENMQIQQKVCVRAGADQMLLWMPGQNETKVRQLIETVQEDLAKFINKEYLTLQLICGMSEMQGALTLEKGIEQVELALMLAK